MHLNVEQCEHYGKPDYQASAMVISESHRVMKMMAITNEAGSDDGRPRTLGPSREYGGSLSVNTTQTSFKSGSRIVINCLFEVYH